MLCCLFFNFLFLPIVMIFTTAFFFGILAGVAIVEFNKKIGLKMSCCGPICCPLIFVIYLIEICIGGAIALALTVVIVGLTIIPSYII
jgi:hypothetical protein